MLAKVRQTSTEGGPPCVCQAHCGSPIFSPKCQLPENESSFWSPSATVEIETPQILLICVGQLENC